MTVLGRLSDAVVRALVRLLRGYQTYVSPALPPTCRFYPTCSAYAVEALQVHGVVRGVGLTTWRLLRCAPWHPGGIDPVPPRRGDHTCTAVIRVPPSLHAAAELHEEQGPC